MENVNKKPILWLIGALTAIALFMGLGLSMNKTEYVASIDGEKISQDELHESLVSQYGTDALNALVTEKIVEMEIGKAGVEVSQKEVDQKLKEYKEYYGGEDAFQEVINTSGVDLSDIKKNIETSLAINKILEGRITITEDEMKTYFEEHKDQFAQQEQVQASHILVKDEATANEVIKKLKAGEKFSDLAKEYSIDETSSEAGGDLGSFGKGKMVKEFEDAAFALAIGDVSEPVKTDYGFHIIKVVDKVAAKDANYEDAKDKIKSAIFESKAQKEYSVWLEEKTADYDIKYMLND